MLCLKLPCVFCLKLPCILRLKLLYEVFIASVFIACTVERVVFVEHIVAYAVKALAFFNIVFNILDRLGIK